MKSLRQNETLQRIFTRYPIHVVILWCILACVLPVISSILLILFPVGLLVILLISLLVGWLAAKADLPDSLFARMMPMLLPLPLFLLCFIVFLHLIPPGNSQFFFFWPTIIVSGACYCGFLLVFLVRSEWRRKSTRRGTPAGFHPGKSWPLCGILSRFYFP